MRFFLISAYLSKIARSMSCGVVLPPIVEAARFGVPSTLIAKRALGVVIVVSLFRSMRYNTEGPEAPETAAKAKPLSPPALG